jgi:hypothetical protein
MADKAVGIETNAAAKKATVWGTAVAAGAGDGIKINNHTIVKTVENHMDSPLGCAFVTEQDQGEQAVAGDIEAFLRYDSLDLLIALAMGATGGAPSQQGATTAYAQSFTLANTLDALFATLVLENNVNIDEYPGLKVAGFTIAGEINAPVTITFHVICDKRETDSVTNTDVTFANVTFTETKNRVIFGQGVYRMNDASDIALAAGDAIYPSAFELVFQRNLAGKYTRAGFDYIDEPSSDGEPTITLQLTFPRYTTKTPFTDWDADTIKKLDITFTGAEIEAPYNRVFLLSFPNLKTADANLEYVKEIMPYEVTFTCLPADAAPAGMVGITLPFQIDVINQETADVLA